MPADPVNTVIADWQRERPGTDVSGLAVMARVNTLSKYLHRRDKRVMADLGIEPWGFEVLSALRRQGPPFELSPTQLRRYAVLSSGAMTNRLDRLEAQGLVRRHSDPDDRRGLRIQLTKRGKKLADKAFDARLTELDRVLQPLTREERRTVGNALSKIIEGYTPRG